MGATTFETESIGSTAKKAVLSQRWKRIRCTLYQVTMSLIAVWKSEHIVMLIIFYSVTMIP